MLHNGSCDCCGYCCCGWNTRSTGAKSREENKNDHGIVASLLQDLHNDIVKVENKLVDKELTLFRS